MQISYIAFGGLQVVVDGVARAVGRAREREVLATLLAARESPVSAERLATDIWGAESGPTTLPLVQVAVSRLRSLLEPERVQRGGQLIISEPGGYVLRVDTADVDVWRFQELAGEVLGGGYPPAQVAAMCEEAEALWAMPYAGILSPGPQRHADRLIELHTDLHAEHGRALLDLGHHDAAVRLLAPVVAEHPFREPLWCLLALAQYRSGRQGDALSTIRQLRTAMVQELGVDPVPSTLQLEAAMLQQDASLFLADPLVRNEMRASHEGSVPTEATGHALVGRVEELETGLGLLDRAVERATRQQLLVTGEGGIGKTAYLDVLKREACARGFDVVVGATHPDELAPALWPWAEIVRSLVDPDDLDEHHELHAVVATSPRAPAAASPLRTFDAVVALLAEHAERRPLLLVIEDLQWADTASLRLLRHLVEARLDVPLVVAVSRRSTDRSTRDLLDCLAALARAGVTRVPLDGLSAHAVAELIDHTISECSDDLAAFVSEVTGGNPFFILQYIGLLASRMDLDVLVPADLQVPESITDVLRQRLRNLPEDALRTVEAASVLGRSFAPSALAAMLERPIDELLDALDHAARAGLVVDDGAGYSFVHALAQAAAYRELPSGRRIRLHDRAGRALEDLPGPHGHRISAIAHHAWAAASLSTGHRDRAVEWRIRAADIELSRYAATEALALWRGIHELVEPDSVATARAHGGIAVALMQLSRIGEAAVEIEAGVDVACRLGEWELLAELVATLATAGPWAFPTHGRFDTTFLDQLRSALPHVTPGSRALLLAVLEVELFTLGRDEDRGLYAEEAIELSADADVDLRRRVLLFIAVGTTGIWSPTRRLAVVEELLALEPVDGLLMNALLSLAVVEWENRHPDAADEAMERGVAEARRLGTAEVDLAHAWWMATRARDRGDHDADALLCAAVELHRRSGVGSLQDAQVLAAVHRSRESDALELLRNCPVPVSSTVQAMLAHALLEQGDVDRARSLMALWDDGTPSVHHEIVGACFQLLVLAELGTPEQIRAGLARIEPHRGSTVALSALADHSGVVDHFVAAGYAAVSDPRAATVAAEALRANEELGCKPWAARSARLLASLTNS